ncbi:MAG: dUTP diphosphatase [Phascolarctobacterium sp.]|nr:dUTP diphosphatase [Phascolarctobacterium sp.]
MSVKVKIKILPGGKMPERKTACAAAYDCYAKEDVTVGEHPTLIGLGFALELPEGYHAEIVPRSSIGLKTNLRQPNCVGIIDSDYRGEVKAMYESKLVTACGMLQITFKPVHIKAGERIAQMLIKKNEDVTLVEVDELSETDRGDGGFGSTGKR